MITQDLKLKVLAALAEKRPLFSGTDGQFATSIGISAPQYSRIKGGEIERVISDASWISIARQCNVMFSNTIKWVTAITPVFKYITEQLTFCQANAASRQLCDLPDIGKTHAAKEYAANNPNVVYVDCSQVKTKQALVRYIAKSFGINSVGKYKEVYDDLIYYLKYVLPSNSAVLPLIILDEAGDLTYEADLETKALWNALEGFCSWYKMGADGLKAKFTRRITSKKVGYTELHSRFGNTYQKASPDSEHEQKEFKGVHAAMIIKANFPANTDINKTIAKAGFTLRNLKDERRKLSA